MTDSPLIIKSKAFTIDVIQVCKELRATKCESALINQLIIKFDILSEKVLLLS